MQKKTASRRRRWPGCVALPIAGYATFYLMKESPFEFGGDEDRRDLPRSRRRGAEQANAAERAEEGKSRRGCGSRDARALCAGIAAETEATAAVGAARTRPRNWRAGRLPAAPVGPMHRRPRRATWPGCCRQHVPDAAAGGRSKLMAQQPRRAEPTMPLPQEENRDRVEEFKTNPVHAGA